MAMRINFSPKAIRKSLSSLENMVDDILVVMDTIEQNDTTGKDTIPLYFMFSSRGSFPILQAIDHATQIKKNNRIDLRVIPHIYSIENMTQILSNYEAIFYDQYMGVVEYLSDNIASVASTKIETCCRESNAVLSDWDEVITGNNLLERVKIYNKYNIGSSINHHIISFLADQSKNVHKFNKPKLRRHKKKSPGNYNYIDVSMKEMISWSDDENFFNNLALTYPQIAVPKAEEIRNHVKKQFVPYFYGQFFSQHCTRVANQAGYDGNMRYKLKIIQDSGVLDTINSPKYVLDLSLSSFLAAIDATEKKGGLMEDSSLAESRYIPDFESGIILQKKRNGQEVPLLYRNSRPDRVPKEFTHRNPFILFYQANTPSGMTMGKLMKQYFKNVRYDSK